MRRCLVCLNLLLGCLPAVRTEDSLVGQRVVVIRDNAALETNGKEVAKAAECTVFTVNSVQGSFLWIESEKAYVRRNDVVPFPDAIAHYTRQLETDKTAQNYWHRAQIWQLKGELDFALGDMNEAIQLNSTESIFFDNRGTLWKEKMEYDKAIADYSEAIRLDPMSGWAYNNRGLAWHSKKEYDKAIADYDEARKHTNPNEKVSVLCDSEITSGDFTAMVDSRALTFNNRGWAWQNKGNYDKALIDYETAIRLDPKYQQPRINRRDVWVKQKAWNKVIADYEATLQESTPTAADCNELAWLRATCPDERYRNGKQAVEFATKACELSAWKEANNLETLAAAYAEVGDYDQAVEWQKKGLDLATADEKADFETRLKLYQDKKPCRQPAGQ